MRYLSVAETAKNGIYRREVFVIIVLMDVFQGVSYRKDLECTGRCNQAIASKPEGE